MAASYTVHTHASIEHFGDPVTLADGTQGRQRIGTVQKKVIAVHRATIAELQELIRAQFPGGVGEFQLNSSDPEVDPFERLVDSTWYVGTLTGSKNT